MAEKDIATIGIVRSELNSFDRAAGRLGAHGQAIAGVLGFVSAWGIACLFELRTTEFLLMFFGLTAGPMVALSVLSCGDGGEASGLVVHTSSSINWHRIRSSCSASF